MLPPRSLFGNQGCTTAHAWSFGPERGRLAECTITHQLHRLDHDQGHYTVIGLIPEQVELRCTLLWLRRQVGGVLHTLRLRT